MSQKKHSVRYNFIMNFLLTASNFIFPLVTFPYASRILLSEGTGVVAFATSVTNYFAMVASLGIPTYGIRVCAKARDNKEELTKVSHEIFLINAVMSVISIVAFLAAIFFVPQFREEKALFLINASGILLNLIGVNWLYQALEQYDYITFRSLASKVLSVVLLFLLVHQKSDYVVYGAIGVFAAAGANVLNFVRAGKYISFRKQSGYQFCIHFKPILTLFAQTIVISIYTNLDTVMLGFMNGNSEVGIYTTAVKVKTILVTLVTSLGAVLLPRVSNVLQKGDMTQFRNLAKKSLNCTFLMAIPLSIYFCVYAKDSILLLAGEGFLDAVTAMQIITIAVIPIGITGVLGIQVLVSMEKEKYVLYSVSAGAVIDFLLNLVFIPQYGAAGAALATTIAEFFVLFIQLYYTKNLVFPMMKELRFPIYALATALGAISSYFVMAFVIIGSSFVRLCISALIYFGIYFVLLTATKEPLIWGYLSRFLRKGEK